jgi:GH24 family phage-related lysozyme (muramidase)
MVKIVDKRGLVLWGAAVMSAAGIAFTLGFEGRPKPGATEAVAIVPVKGDPATLDVGGLTYYPSTGNRVQLGERIPIERAITEFSLATEEDTDCVRRSCPDCETPQPLFDLAGDFVHQFGCTKWRNGTPLKLIRARKFSEYCVFFFQYRFVRGIDCSTPGNRVCGGVWTRAQARAELCRASLSSSNAKQ